MTALPDHNNRLEPTIAALLVDSYREAEDVSGMGLFRRMELGSVLFELMNYLGETRLRRTLTGSCPEISWEAANKMMHLALVAGPEFFAASSWLNRLDLPTFAWLTNHYQQAQFLCDLGLLRRVKLGDRLLELMTRVGESQLRRILAKFCPEIPWEDAELAMTFARVCNRGFLETSCRRDSQAC
jgi:hypothetical protein